MTQDSTGAGPQFREAGNGCRTIDVSPSDVRDGRLQQLTGAAVACRAGEDSSTRVTICLQPGRYRLQQPITLREQHSNLALRGCPEATVINAATGFETAFSQGMIVLVGTNNVTITGLELDLPQVPAALASARASRQQGKAFADAANEVALGRWISIGIRPAHCAVLAITGICLIVTTAAALTDLGGTINVPGGLKDQADAVRTAFVTGLHDPVLLLLLVFGQTFPLPGFGTLTRFSTPAINAVEVQKLRTAGDQARRDRVTRFVNDIAAGLEPAAPPRRGAAKTAAADTSTAATPVDFNQDTGSEVALLQQGSPSEQQLRVANACRAALARLAQTAAQSALTLRIEGNDIACGLAEPDTSGPATLIYTSDLATSAEITNNRMSSTGTRPAASLIVVGNQPITGNIVTTTNEKATTLAIAASPHVAIIGNIITGIPALPANRPYPPPFDSWLPLNTIV